jgi:hypothetical protein
MMEGTIATLEEVEEGIAMIVVCMRMRLGPRIMRA